MFVHVTFQVIAMLKPLVSLLAFIWLPPSMNIHINDSEPYKPSMGKLEKAETKEHGETDLVTPPEGVPMQANPENRKDQEEAKKAGA